MILFRYASNSLLNSIRLDSYSKGIMRPLILIVLSEKLISAFKSFKIGEPNSPSYFGLISNSKNSTIRSLPNSLMGNIHLVEVVTTPETALMGWGGIAFHHFSLQYPFAMRFTFDPVSIKNLAKRWVTWILMKGNSGLDFPRLAYENFRCW